MNSQDKILSNTSFVNKDFNSIWNEFLELVPKLTRKWLPSEANESDPLAVALKLIAIALDKGNYAIDKSLLELYPLSLTQEASAYRVYDALNYKIRWYESGRGFISVRYNKPEGNIKNNPSLKKYDMITNEDNTVIYTIISDTVELTEAVQVFTAEVMQGAVKDFVINGQTLVTTQNLDSENRLYFTESNVAQNGIFVTSEGNEWKCVDNLALYSGDSYVYTFGLDTATNSCYIQFPKDVANLCGPGFTIKYLLSEGSRGNVLRGDLTVLYSDSKIEFDGSDSKNLSEQITLFNNAAISNGRDPEKIDEMYETYKRTANLLNTLVTLEDYRNYLLTHISSNNNKLVSNCQVSDRTCDLLNTYIVKSMNTSGKFTDVMRNGSMNAFQLRLYPLTYSSDTTNKQGYDISFTTATNQQEIEEELSRVRVVNHDFLKSGNLFILDATLRGIVYLESQVSARDARDILSNIYTAIYQNFNSSKLVFGKEISYADIVETIQAADTRIKYVALNPLDELKLEKAPLEDMTKVYKRSVLKGVTPWAVTGTPVDTPAGIDLTNRKDGQDSQFKLSYAQNFIKVNSVPKERKFKLKDDKGKEYVKTFQNYLVGGVYLTGLNNKTIQINENEQYYYVYPSYKAVTTYSNYLYYTTNIKEVGKDVMYQLGSDEYIRIYLQRDDADDDFAYEIKPNELVKCNFGLNATIAGTKGTLNSNLSISVMQAVSSESFTEGDCVYFSTEDLFKRVVMKPQSDVRTLLYNDEFIIYYNKLSLNFEILGAGNTVFFSGTTNEPYKEFIYKSADITLSNIEETGDLSSLDECWMPLQKDSPLIRSSNDILVLGEGYKLEIKEGTTQTWGTILNRSSSGEIILSPVDVYRSVTENFKNVVYYKGNDSEGKPLPLSSSKVTCYFFAAVNITSNSSNPGRIMKQEEETGIVSSQQLLYSYIFDDSTSPNLRLYYPEGTTTIPTASDPTNNQPEFSFQPNINIVCPGGMQFIDTDFDLYCYKEKEEVPPQIWQYVTQGNFASVGSQDVDLTVPGDVNKQLVIIPYMTSEKDVVKYKLCKPSSKVEPSVKVTFKAGTYVGGPYAISNESYYYANGAFNKVSDLLETDTSFDLTTTQLYDEAYSPVYRAPENSIILYPEKLLSYLNKQHVMNRYTLEKLVFDTNTLFISPLSIK